MGVKFCNDLHVLRSSSKERKATHKRVMRFGSVPVLPLPFSSLGLYSCSKLWIKITGCGAKNGLQIECWTWLQSYLIWINIYLNVQNIRFKACTQNVCSSHRGRIKQREDMCSVRICGWTLCLWFISFDLFRVPVKLNEIDTVGMLALRRDMRKMQFKRIETHSDSIWKKIIYLMNWCEYTSERMFCRA